MNIEGTVIISLKEYEDAKIMSQAVNERKCVFINSGYQRIYIAEDSQVNSMLIDEIETLKKDIQMKYERIEVLQKQIKENKWYQFWK